LTVTPLQVARLMAAIANGGRLVTPHVVRGFGPSLADNDRSPLLPAGHEPTSIAGLTPGTLERVREGLERVVAHPTGTGYKHVRLEEIAIAGKSGTAEVGGGKADHAWFAGYVPADRPKIAFAVVLEHSGSGGAVAGSAAREMVRTMLELRLVE
jgi:penicillin-binding protein 2